MKVLRISFLFFAFLSIALGCKKKATIVNNNVTPNDFLSEKKYNQLVIEIKYADGQAPTQDAIDNLKAFLSQRLNKSGGINVVMGPIASPGKAVYTLEDIRKIESQYRTQNTDGTTLTAFFFFADADFADNNSSSKVLGIAYGSSSMVIFESTIKQFSGGLGQPARRVLESTVIHHELGHTLGLVDNGSPMQTSHQDVANGKHCSNKNCLMYYATENSDFVSNLLGGNIPTLDANCENDLKANGGK